MKRIIHIARFIKKVGWDEVTSLLWYSIGMFWIYLAVGLTIFFVASSAVSSVWFLGASYWLIIVYRACRRRRRRRVASVLARMTNEKGQEGFMEWYERVNSIKK